MAFGTVERLEMAKVPKVNITIIQSQTVDRFSFTFVLILPYSRFLSHCEPYQNRGLSRDFGITFFLNQYFELHFF